MSTARTDIEDYWRVDGAAGDFPIDYRAPATRALVPGDDMSMQAVFSGYSDSLSGAWPDHDVRRDAVVSTYGGHAGDFALHDPMGGTDGGVSYTETHDGASLLIAIRPPHGMDAIYGAWALIKSLQDNSRPGRANVKLSLVYVAALDEYSDHAAVRTALEREGIGF